MLLRALILLEMHVVGRPSVFEMIPPIHSSMPCPAHISGVLMGPGRHWSHLIIFSQVCPPVGQHRGNTSQLHANKTTACLQMPPGHTDIPSGTGSAQSQGEDAYADHEEGCDLIGRVIPQPRSHSVFAHMAPPPVVLRGPLNAPYCHRNGNITPRISSIIETRP